MTLAPMVTGTDAASVSLRQPSTPVLASTLSEANGLMTNRDSFEWTYRNGQL